MFDSEKLLASFLNHNKNVFIYVVLIFFDYHWNKNTLKIFKIYKVFDVMQHVHSQKVKIQNIFTIGALLP